MLTKPKLYRNIFTSLNRALNRKALSFLIMTLIVAAVPLTVVSAQQQQDIRQRASEFTTTPPYTTLPYTTLPYTTLPFPITPTPTPILACSSYGDVNSDGTISKLDSDLVSQYTVGNIVLSNNQKLNADVNNDGKIDIGDAMFIQQFVDKKRTTFPVCVKPTPIPPNTTKKYNVLLLPYGKSPTRKAVGKIILAIPNINLDYINVEVNGKLQGLIPNRVYQILLCSSNRGCSTRTIPILKSNYSGFIKVSGLKITGYPQKRYPVTSVKVVEKPNPGPIPANSCYSINNPCLSQNFSLYK